MALFRPGAPTPHTSTSSPLRPIACVTLCPPYSPFTLFPSCPEMRELVVGSNALLPPASPYSLFLLFPLFPPFPEMWELVMGLNALFPFPSHYSLFPLLAPFPPFPEMRELVMEKVRKHFQPEFVNRIDEFIIFEPLAADQIETIVRLQVRGVGQRLSEKKMKLLLHDSAVK